MKKLILMSGLALFSLVSAAAVSTTADNTATVCGLQMPLDHLDVAVEGVTASQLLELSKADPQYVSARVCQLDRVSASVGFGSLLVVTTYSQRGVWAMVVRPK